MDILNETFNKQLNLIHSKLLSENMRMGKQLVASEKLSKEDLVMIAAIDTTKTKKFVGWMAKEWVLKHVDDKDELRNTMEEFILYLSKGKTKNNDINQYKTFKDLASDVTHLNNTGSGLSVKDLENDSETVVDDDNLLVMVPHTHEASRKLGLSHFSFKDCTDEHGAKTGHRASNWCTTYGSPTNFNDYYFNHNVTLYYILVKSDELKSQLEGAGFGPSFYVSAIAVVEGGQMEGYDGEDKKFTGDQLQKYLDIIGLE